MNRQGEKKTTIDEVARQCGVSKTTISRFLNGRYENISLETKERIHKVIVELDYRPNRSAQRLKASRSMLVGCIVGDIGSPFSALLVKGIISVCEAEGYQVLFADCDDDPARERAAIDGFLANRVDGLIVNTSGGNDENLLATRDSGIPVVLADRSLMKSDLLDTVAIPNHDKAFECVRLMKDYGYERVAFFTEGNRRISPRLLRYQGYLDAVRELFPGKEPEMYEFRREDIENCRSQIFAYRNKYPGERIGVLSVNGVTTQRLLHAFKDSGLTPGYDYGLCGFDDWSWLQLATPGVTSVAVDTKSVGAEAAMLLMERISGKRPMDAPAVMRELPTEIVVRGSTVREK